LTDDIAAASKRPQISPKLTGGRVSMWPRGRPQASLASDGVAQFGRRIGDESRIGGAPGLQPALAGHVGFRIGHRVDGEQPLAREIPDRLATGPAARADNGAVMAGMEAGDLQLAIVL